MSRKALRVFEHEKLHVSESGDAIRPHEFDALLKFNDENGSQYFDVGHKHLRAKSFVGYIEVGKLAIEILPKADRGATQSATVWRDGLIEMLHVALGLRLERHPDAAQEVSQARLIDLIAQAFLAEVEPLLHEGLAKGYRTEQSNGAVFRGRLKIADQIRENAARADRFFVEYQTFDHDIIVNRLLAAALHALSWAALSPSVAARVEDNLARFPDVTTSQVTAATFERVRFSRSTTRYRHALTYARMILAHQGPQLRGGRQRVFALLFNMNLLWERYIAVLLRRVVPAGLSVHTQEHHDFWAPQSHVVRQVKPDIVIRSEPNTSAVLVIDTKWKVPKNGLPSDEDLKQMFVYNELLGGAKSILLYPRTTASFYATGDYVSKNHKCEQCHVGLFDGARWSNEVIKQQLGDLLRHEQQG
jgi:5-methylcytosine-specific restriction enzyme subunit McrC